MTPQHLATLHAAAFSTQRPWSEQEFATLLQSPYVFIISDHYCFALGRAIMDEVELLTLATAPDHRRQGHAQRCLDRFHHAARLRQASKALLEVAVDNQAAYRLYENNQYHVVAERPNYYRRPDGQRISARIMSRVL